MGRERYRSNVIMDIRETLILGETQLHPRSARLSQCRGVLDLLRLGGDPHRVVPPPRSLEGWRRFTSWVLAAVGVAVAAYVVLRNGSTALVVEAELDTMA